MGKAKWVLLIPVLFVILFLMGCHEGSTSVGVIYMEGCHYRGYCDSYSYLPPHYRYRHRCYRTVVVNKPRVVRKYNGDGGSMRKKDGKGLYCKMRGEEKGQGRGRGRMQGQGRGSQDRQRRNSGQRKNRNR